MFRKRALTLVFAPLALTGCGDPEWFGVVYPNINNRNNSRTVGMYKTLAECQEAMQQEFFELRLGGAGGPRMAMECQSECDKGADGQTVCKRVEPGVV